MVILCFCGLRCFLSLTPGSGIFTKFFVFVWIVACLFVMGNEVRSHLFYNLDDKILESAGNFTHKIVLRLFYWYFSRFLHQFREEWHFIRNIFLKFSYYKFILMYFCVWITCSCKNSTKCSYVPFTELLWMIICYVTTVHYENQ